MPRLAPASSLILRLSALSLAATTLMLTGCGIGNMATEATPSASASATISGHLHGGNQPIGGAIVTLLSAGATGYGSAGLTFASTTSLSDSSGSFSFVKSATNSGPGTGNMYGCPAVGDPQMYIVAHGGNTQGTGNGTNAAAGFIAAIGKCSIITNTTFIDLNEVTTVATMAALQQYFNPVTEGLGYPASPQGTLGYANALTTIANLANIASGVANGVTTITSTITLTPAVVGPPAVPAVTGPVTVTVTPEQAKLNTIANILASCVNTTTSGSQATCTTLYNNANPPVPANTSQPGVTMAKATDVLQAAYYMMTNPADLTAPGATSFANIKALYGLSSSMAPFQPTVATNPTDWTLGIRYSSASACTYGTFLTAPYDLQADANGNIWVAAGGTSTTSSNLLELTPNGTPATCALGTAVAQTKGLTIDTGGYVWISSQSTTVPGAPFYKYNTADGTYTTFPTSAATVPYAVAADGAGNIYYTDVTNKVVNEFVGGATATTAVASTNIATVSASAFFLAVDTAGTIIATNSTTTPNVLYDIYQSTGTGNTNGFLTATIGTNANVLNPYAVAVGLGGRFYLGNSASGAATSSQSAYYLTQAAGTPTFSTNTAQYSAGIGSPRGPNVVDGAGNVWYANSLASTGNYAAGTTTANYNVAEFTSGLVYLSPDGQTGGYQKDSTIYNSAPRSLTIDPSGNVWGGSNSGTGNGVFEIVGAAVPVVTPIAASLAKSILNGSFDGVSKP